MVAAIAVTATATATALAAAGNRLASASGIKNRQLALGIPALAFNTVDFLVCIGHGAYRFELFPTVLAFIFVDRHNAPILHRL